MKLTLCQWRWALVIIQPRVRLWGSPNPFPWAEALGIQGVYRPFLDHRVPPQPRLTALDHSSKFTLETANPKLTAPPWRQHPPSWGRALSPSSSPASPGAGLSIWNAHRWLRSQPWSLRCHPFLSECENLDTSEVLQEWNMRREKEAWRAEKWSPGWAAERGKC